MPLTGLELKALRVRLKLTQRELAETVGLTATSIARFEMPANADNRYPVPHWLGLLVFHLVNEHEGKKHATKGA